MLQATQQRQNCETRRERGARGWVQSELKEHKSQTKIYELKIEQKKYEMKI